MKLVNEKIIRDAQEFAARWGFITRDLFFDFFCSMSQAQQYRYWSYLVERGLFYRSHADSKVLLLSRMSRARLGSVARPARLPMYVAHDALIARVYLAMWQRGMIVRSWLEDELMRSPLEAYSILGADRIHRIPDLVFDLKVHGDGTSRCALEIEKTVKSQTRYAKIALAYLDYSNVNLMLFGCGGSVAEAAVRKAFDGKVFVDRKRVPGLFQVYDFDSETLQTPIRFQTSEFQFQKFLEIVTKAEVPKVNSLREFNENPFSLRISKKAETE